MNVASAYPNYAGLSPSREENASNYAPDGWDYSQLVAELVKHQSLLAGRVRSLTGVASAGTTSVCNVLISATDELGVLLAGVHVFEVWLSDAASGAGLTAVTASGTVTVKAASGEIIGTLTTKKALMVQTLATGLFTLEITDAAKTAFKVCARCPGTGLTIVLCTLITANYG